MVTTTIIDSERVNFVFVVPPHDAVEVECNDESMTVSILNSAYDNVTFTLQDASCDFTNNGTHNTITISYDTCNTNLSETTDYLIYRNKAETKTNPAAIISRDPDHYVEILCKLERNSSISSSQLNVSNFDSINITKGKQCRSSSMESWISDPILPLL